MLNNFTIFFFLSFLYCGFILCLAYFLIYKKIKLNPQNIVSFSAGTIIVLVLFEYLPHSLDMHNNIYNSVIFILVGFLTNAFAEVVILPRIKFLNKLLPKEKHDCQQHDSQHIHHHLIPSSAGCSIAGCLILCAFFDGIRFASSLLIHVEAAIIIGIGLLFHLIPESVAVIGVGLSAKLSRKSLLRITIAFCLAFLAGYQLFFLLSHMKYLQSFLLPFVSGLFIYICFVHFIPMVIKMKTKRWFILSAGLCFLFLQVSHPLLH